MLQILHPERLIAFGFILLGSYVAIVGSGYGIGDLVEMEPGYFPVIIGVILALLGATLIVTGILGPREKVERGPLGTRQIVMVSTGIFAWAALARNAGLVPATFTLVVISSLAEARPRPLKIGLLALVLSTVCYLIFIEALELPLRAFAI